MLVSSKHLIFIYSPGRRGSSDKTSKIEKIKNLNVFSKLDMVKQILH